MEPLGNNNQELTDALAEFEAKSGAESVPQSPDTVPAYSVEDASGMVRRVMKYSGGLIKTKEQANYILLAFIVIAMGLSFYFFFGGHTPTPSPINPVQIPAGRP